MALLPEVGAQYGISARWDLCGGCRVTGIPTATVGGTLDFYYAEIVLPAWRTEEKDYI